MRTLPVLLVLCIALGCSRQPDLTPEQKAALQTLGEMQTPDDPRQIAASERLSAIGRERGLDLQWLEVQAAIDKESVIRYKRDGVKKTVDWYEAESKKSADQLIKDWAPPSKP